VATDEFVRRKPSPKKSRSLNSRTYAEPRLTH